MRANDIPDYDAIEVVAVRCLLVTPDAAMASRCAAGIAGHDCSLAVASDWFEAGELCEATRPNTFVLDLSAGRAEALTCARRLRARKHLAEAIIVAVANEDESYFLPFHEAGFSSFFQRPFDPALLIEAILAAGAP